MTTALLLVDIQNDYFPGGAMEVPGSVAAAEHAAALLAACRQRRLFVVHVRHVSTRPGASFFLPDTAGAAIHASVAPLAGETEIVKHFPNSFRDTPLLDHLKKIGAKRLLICGMMTQMCIDATTRAAFDLGFQCVVAGDACAARPQSFGGRTVAAEDVHAAFLAALNGLYARVLTSEAVIAESL
ncbi:MAG: cysteine hydrolase [Gammaproteobacteria bacterium]|nr:cysteine hydrolase [Gammaproteobacteria bacterium]MBU1645609.1 cysteine hydrolase [Gammaproteobacteria bacterium]MBU1973589.1 cysteine hydrolase [Gammaproteobacteria bacterium]